MAAATVGTPVRSIDDLRHDRTGHAARRTAVDRVISYLLPLLFVVAIFPILDLVYWISRKALPDFTVQTITTNPNGNTGGLWAPLVGSVEILILATLVAIALGFLGGLATAEFLPERAAGTVRITANVMVGTPAIIVGLFGYFAFVTYFGWGFSLAAAGLTLGIFMTPYVFRATDLAYASVPPHIKEAALGSGAAPFQYLLRVATPIAFPQILTGVFLAMAIGVGETAPLVLTTVQTELPATSLLTPSNALPFYIWSGYTSVFPSEVRLAFQAAFLLLIIVVGLNILVRVIAARARKRLEGLFQ